MILLICGFVALMVSLILFGIAIVFFIFDRKEIQKIQTLTTKLQQINLDTQFDLSASPNTQSDYSNNKSGNGAECCNRRDY